jgi:hypothetical protein
MLAAVARLPLLQEALSVIVSDPAARSVSLRV